jgi:hypothetical protein
MERKSNILLILLNFSLLLTFISCATVTKESPKTMVPYLDYSTFTFSGKTIKISTVKLGQIETPRESLMITGEDFQEALKETFVKARIFKVISEEQSANYECQTNIVSQKIIPGLTTNAILFINYKIIDESTKEAVFNESFLSHIKISGIDASNAFKSAARDNLSKFIMKLPETF